ncbi:MAG: hypothetical protein NTV94_11030 [Planctomycetota bacterium]|nr:hypothetical protein [Planctomycetota bacterium]
MPLNDNRWIGRTPRAADRQAEHHHQPRASRSSVFVNLSLGIGNRDEFSECGSPSAKELKVDRLPPDASSDWRKAESGSARRLF